MGAPGAPHAALLLPHRRGPGRVRAARRGGPPVPRFGEHLDRRDRARGLRRVRRARAEGNVPLAPEAALRLWADPDRWAGFVEGFARVVEGDAGWPAVGSRVVWES